MKAFYSGTSRLSFTPIHPYGLFCAPLPLTSHALKSLSSGPATLSGRLCIPRFHRSLTVQPGPAYPSLDAALRSALCVLRWTN